MRLTERETGLIRESFHAVSQDAAGSAASFYAHLYRIAPETEHLFVADAGDATSLGGVTEVSLTQVAALDVPVVGATLVQTIDTSVWVPASPDPSGVVYLPHEDRLLVEAVAQRSQHGARLGGVGGSGDELQRHGVRYRSRRGRAA